MGRLISLVVVMSTIIMVIKAEGLQFPFNRVSSSSNNKKEVILPPRDFLHEEKLLSNEFNTGSLYW